MTVALVPLDEASSQHQAVFDHSKEWALHPVDGLAVTNLAGAENSCASNTMEDMERSQISDLLGAQVWVKRITKYEKSEVHGVIEAAIKPFETTDREKAIRLTVFSVVLDSGERIVVPGSSFSRFTPTS